MWQAARGAINKSRTRFPHRSKITIWVNYSDSEGCLYTSAPDRIELRNTALQDCIWGPYGYWVVAHEYGHALHEEKGGGLPAVSNLCSLHFPGADTDLSCAYIEGFADYHGTVTYDMPYVLLNSPGFPLINGPSFPMTLLAIEANAYNRNSLGVVDPLQDGSIDEGQVAAFFFDLTDVLSGEVHDNLAIDDDDLLDVMRTCRVLQGGSWRAPDGIDHLIWCLENQVDSVTTSNSSYFPTRNPDPTAENRNTHSWSPSDVRTNWLWNLYGEGD